MHRNLRNNVFFGLAYVFISMSSISSEPACLFRTSKQNSRQSMPERKIIILARFPQFAAGSYCIWAYWLDFCGCFVASQRKWARDKAVLFNMRRCLGILVFYYSSVSQGVVPRTSHVTCCLCKMQILKFYILPTNSTSRDRAQQSVLTNSLGDSDMGQHGDQRIMGAPTLRRLQIVPMLICGARSKYLTRKLIKLCLWGEFWPALSHHLQVAMTWPYV